MLDRIALPRMRTFLVLLLLAIPLRVAAQASVNCSPPGPLTQQRMAELAGKVGEPRLIQYVMTCGVGFAVTAEEEGKLRAAGVSETVIQLIREKGRRAAPAGKPAPPSGASATQTTAPETRADDVRKLLEKADDAFSRLDFDTGRRDYESAENLAPDNADAKDGLQKINKYQLEATAYLLRTWPADMCLIVTAAVHCPGPLGEEELERWTSRESELWLFNVVRQCRVNFKVTPEVEGRLRAAHMSESLIAAIRNAQPQDSGRVRGFAGRSQQQTIEAHLAEADVAFAVGEYDHALAEYEAVKQLQPDNARANQGIEKVRKALAAEGSANPTYRTPR
jgi:hypothetical protein